MPCYKDPAPRVQFGRDWFSKQQFVVRIVTPAFLKITVFFAVAGANGYAQGPKVADYGAAVAARTAVNELDEGTVCMRLQACSSTCRQ